MLIAEAASFYISHVFNYNFITNFLTQCAERRAYSTHNIGTVHNIATVHNSTAQTKDSIIGPNVRIIEYCSIFLVFPFSFDGWQGNTTLSVHRLLITISSSSTHSVCACVLCPLLFVALAPSSDFHLSSLMQQHSSQCVTYRNQNHQLNDLNTSADVFFDLHIVLFAT